MLQSSTSRDNVPFALLVYAFGQFVEPKNWNDNKQRVKNNKTTTDDGKHLLNDLLDNLQKVCENAYNTEIKNGNFLI